MIEVFLFTFFPANRTEVDDAFWYAGSIRDYPYIDLFNPRFFLFLPLLKGIYDILTLIGVNIDAYYYLCTVSAVFSALTILLLYDTLRKYLGFGRFTALFVVGLLGISYEFWRYSMEAEVYIFAMFFVLLTLRLFLQWQQEKSFRNLLFICLVGGFTTLIYKPSFIPVYLIFPLYFLYHKAYFQFIIYNAIGAVIIVGSFLVVYLQMDAEYSFLEYLFGGANEPTGSPLGAIFVVASNMLAVLWVFGWDAVAAFIIDRFPHKVVEEELFLAQQVGNIKYLLQVVLLGVIAIFCFLVINGIRRGYSRRRFKKLGVILLWMLVYSAFLLVMDPTSNEPWLMIQIPIVIIFGALFIEPLKKSYRWMAFAFLILVFVNNTVGGIQLLANPEYDYYREKSQWLRANATADDHILTYGPMSLVRYLRYHTPSEVTNVEEDQDQALRVLLNANNLGGDIYFPEDIFHPPEAINYRAKVDVEKFKEVFRRYGYHLRQVAGHDDFYTYKLMKK